VGGRGGGWSQEGVTTPAPPVHSGAHGVRACVWRAYLYEEDSPVQERDCLMR